jgi:ribonuclease E
LPRADDGASDEEGVESVEANGTNGFDGSQSDGSDGERRRRRRGRRGGRRRRREEEEGLAASVADEIEGPIESAEAEHAVTDLDRPPLETTSPEEPQPMQAAVHHEPIVEHAAAPEQISAEPEAAQDKSRRRSTVREKVSFATESTPPASAEPAHMEQSEPVAQAAEPVASAETSTEAAPRRAGWWSRRFGGGS